MKAILNVEAPKTKKEEEATQIYWYSQQLLRHVVSQKSASNLDPLTNSSHQHVFDKIKKDIGTGVLLVYTDFNKYLHIYTDASDHQMGAVIMKDKKPSFYSRNLNTAQKRYTTSERDRGEL
jgi:hypothetical protein